jgi:Flp pilus assembly protein TadD
MMEDHSAWEMAREAAHATGRSDRLLELFPRLVGRYPRSFALRKDYGTTLARAGQNRDAIRQLEAAAGLFSGDAAVFGNLGSLYLAEGKIAEARAALEASIAIDPGRAGPQKNLGIIYLDHLRQPDKAAFHFRKYLEAGGDAEAEAIRAYLRLHDHPGPQGGP